MGGTPLQHLTNAGIQASEAVKLYDEGQHQVYWVGIQGGGEEIECNTYLVVDGGDGFLIEPGGYDRYTAVLSKVNQVMNAMKITHLLVSHQDPDLCASIPAWLRTNNKIKVVLPSQWTRFIPHYMDYNVSQVAGANLSFLPVSDEGVALPLKSGGQIRCISAPYLHSPGNIVMHDTASGFLFSGDIGAAVHKDGRLRLVIEDWAQQAVAMQGFHQRYMSSNRAVSGFLRKLDGIPITALLPQHGSIFRGDEVGKFFRWLEQLPVGVDYLYGAGKA